MVLELYMNKYWPSIGKMNQVMLRLNRGVNSFCGEDTSFRTIQNLVDHMKHKLQKMFNKLKNRCLQIDVCGVRYRQGIVFK